MSFCLKIEVALRNHLKELKGSDLAVFFAIALHMDAERKSFPGVKRISELTGYDKKTVIKSIRSLIDKDLVARTKRYHSSSIYAIKAYVHPLYEAEIFPRSDDNESEEFPPSPNECDNTSCELYPPKDNTKQYKKELRREEKLPSHNQSHEKEISSRQLKDLEKERASIEDQRIEALSEADRQILEEKAYALLPPILRGREFYIRIKMRELLDKYPLDERGII
jgi:DNA replication protein DnaD